MKHCALYVTETRQYESLCKICGKICGRDIIAYMHNTLQRHNSMKHYLKRHSSMKHNVEYVRDNSMKHCALYVIETRQYETLCTKHYRNSMKHFAYVTETCQHETLYTVCKRDKSTASLISRHCNYLFMY